MLMLPRTDQLSEMPAAVRSSALLVTGTTATTTCASVIPHQCRRQRLVQSPVGIRLDSRLGSRRVSHRVGHQDSHLTSRRGNRLVCHQASHQGSRLGNHLVCHQDSHPDNRQHSPR